MNLVIVIIVGFALLVATLWVVAKVLIEGTSTTVAEEIGVVYVLGVLFNWIYKVVDINEIVVDNVQGSKSGVNT